MTLLIRNTQDIAFNHGLKMLIYGAAGAGKTRLCATTGEKTLMLSAESGLLSLRNHPMDVVEIKGIDTMREALKFVISSDHDYKWIAIDSLSEIAEVCLGAEMEASQDGRKAYGDMALVMMKVIRAFRDIKGVNVIFTAKMERTKIEEKILFAPMLPGRQLTANVPYLFDEVFVLRTERVGDKIKRYLQTANDGVYDAKDRSGALEMFEPCNIKRISEKIHTRPPADAGAATQEPVTPTTESATET